MIEVVTVDADSTIRLWNAIEALYPLLALIDVFLDNARYHHARLCAGMACSTGVPDQAAFHSVLLPALNPIERLLGPHAQKRHAQQMLRNMRPIR